MSSDLAAAPRRPQIAIVGSGPSGCYTAQFLRKDLPEARIVIFEALPTPYGLVRYGVAADHQGTKAVTAQFDRLFEKEIATFVGNVRIGADISFGAIAEAFDIVVLATGLTADRPLAIPTDPDAHVIGAGRILRALNAHPEEHDRTIHPLGTDLVIVGHGNVAIDAVRLLTKQPHHLAGSDIDDKALQLLRPTPIKSVHLVGRASAADAKFDLAMLRELCLLDGITIRSEGLEEETAGPVGHILRTAQDQQSTDDGSPRTIVTFHFETQPTEIRFDAGRTVLDTRSTLTGTTTSFDADTVVTAIGFCPADDNRDDTPDESWSGSHVYRVGWVGRGARGNIAENRKHAQSTAKRIVAELLETEGALGEKGGIDAVFPALTTPTVGFSAWKAIDVAERSGADANRCRRKITDITDMLNVAQSATQ